MKGNVSIYDMGISVDLFLFLFVCFFLSFVENNKFDTL